MGEADLVFEKLTQVCEKLGTLQGGVDGICRRLDLLNGSVARHEKAIIQIREREAVRDAVETATTRAREHEEKSVEKVNADYQRWLRPLIRYAVVAGVILLLDRGPQILKVIKGVLG